MGVSSKIKSNSEEELHFRMKSERQDIKVPLMKISINIY